jgi:hypothetical protein
MGDKDSTKTPNEERGETLNPNNPKHQDALDEHSRRKNSQDPRNPPGTTQPSSPPGKGKR